MLLHALPADIQEDLVSTQRMSTDQIMFKLYTIFQPGGQTSLLQLLVDWKSPSNNAAEVAASIRKWKRWAVRAEELHLVLPDPLIMAGVVARMSDAFRTTSSRSAWRTNAESTAKGHRRWVDRNPLATRQREAQRESRIISAGLPMGKRGRSLTC